MYQIAHRGYSDKAKDNTEEAFRLAVQHHFDMIELDIQLCRDDTIIIFHDTILEGKPIKDLAFSELKRLDPSIMSFSNFLPLFYRNGMKLYLDVKGCDVRIAKLLAKELQNWRLDDIFIGSFHVPILEQLRNVMPTVQLGVITENHFSNFLVEYLTKEYELAFFSVHWTMLTDSLVNSMHERNLLVFTYTCKNHVLEKVMRSFSIDGIVTNGLLQ